MNARMEKKFNFDDFYEKYGVYLTLGILVLIVTCLTDSFFTVSNLTNVIRNAAVYLVLAYGVTFIFISGGIDLSVGATLCLASCVVAKCMVQLEMSIASSVLITLATGVVIGAINAFLVGILKVPPFLATLGMQYVIKGIALYITNEVPISKLPAAFDFFGGRKTFGIPNQVIIAAILFVILYIVLNHTKTGRKVFAVGSNEQAAKLNGINVTRVRFFCFIICAVCASIAGIILASRLKVGSATIQSGSEMDAIAAVTIGGTSTGGGRGSLVKTIAGALVITIIRNALNLLNIIASLQSVIVGLVLVLVVAIDMRQTRKGF